MEVITIIPCFQIILTRNENGNKYINKTLFANLKNLKIVGSNSVRTMSQSQINKIQILTNR